MISLDQVSGPPWRVAFIAGDGIGPEVAWAARRCAEATGAALDWVECAAGMQVRARGGGSLPPATVEILRRSTLVLKAPLDGGGDGPGGNPNGALKRLFGVFAAVRRCRAFAPVSARPGAMDLIFVKQVPGEADAPREIPAGVGGEACPPGGALRIHPYSPDRSRRFFAFAFELAQRHGRRRVTVAHQASRYHLTDGRWLEDAAEAARNHPGLEWEEQLADHVALQMVRNPARFDVILAAEPCADLLGDVAVGLAGGLGMVPEALVGDTGTIYTAVHGTAPKYAGLDRANPVAMILASALLLRSVGEDRAAGAIERGVGETLAGGPATADLSDGGVSRGTGDVVNAVIASILAGGGRLPARP